MTNTKKIPQELKRLKRWVLSDSESKCPYVAGAAEKTKASSSDSFTWSDYATAKRDLVYFDHLGFVFADDGYIGIDIDKAFDELGFPDKDALYWIDKIGSYTELSRSKRGFHIIVKGDLNFDGKNAGGWEIYKTNRYFILTGEQINNEPIKQIDQSVLDELLKDKFEIKPCSKTDSFSHKERIYAPKLEIPKASKFKVSGSYDEVVSGKRHISMVSYCGHLRSKGLEFGEIRSKALSLNEKKFIPPLDTKEVERICKSVLRYKPTRKEVIDD